MLKDTSDSAGSHVTTPVEREWSRPVWGVDENTLLFAYVRGPVKDSSSGSDVYQDGKVRREGEEGSTFKKNRTSMSTGFRRGRKDKSFLNPDC